MEKGAGREGKGKGGEVDYSAQLEQGRRVVRASERVVVQPHLRVLNVEFSPFFGWIRIWSFTASEIADQCIVRKHLLLKCARIL